MINKRITVKTPLCHSAGPVDAKESHGRKREREAREQPAVILKVTSPLVFVMPKRLLAVWAIQIRVDMFACYGSHPYCVNI